MKESIGNTYLVLMALTLISIIAALLVASFIYSKTYKIKNRIINIIEKHNGEIKTLDKNDETIKDIYRELGRMGYKVLYQDETCPDFNTYRDEMTEEGEAFVASDNIFELVHDRKNGNYDFCLYRVKTPNYDDSTSTKPKMYYYHLITYTHYDIPIFEQFIKIPITGDTRTYGIQVGG